MSKKIFPCIKSSVLEQISQIIGEVLTGSEIDRFLPECRIINVDPGTTKWKRLYNAFAHYQNTYQVANGVLTFIHTALSPARFINDKEKFENIRSELNKILSFIALEYGENGKFREVRQSVTISDAEKRATSLLSKLKDRNVHADVLAFCKAELLVDNYFHAVFETTKSVADKIRKLTEQTGDGGELVDKVFSSNNPILLINTLITETEKSEHKGFANLLKGFFGMFRNTTAHAPKITWNVSEQDALDIMSLASLFHRRLDNAHRIR